MPAEPKTARHPCVPAAQALRPPAKSGDLGPPKKILSRGLRAAGRGGRLSLDLPFRAGRARRVFTHR